MLAENIKKIIDQARDILVGMVPDPKGQIDQITNALIYKFMNDMDQAAEEMGGKPAYFINGMEKFAWHNLFDSKLDNQQKTLQYSEGIRKFSEAEHLPSLFREIFKDASVTFHAPDTVSLFLDKIDEFPPYQSNSENLGTAFEYLLHFMGTQGKAGQFRTPRHIINFIVDVVAPHKSDTILDPACGTAGFLISAYKYIINNFQLTQREISTLAKNIKGIDIDPQMAKLARVNLYLHGFKQPQISGDDTLTNKNLWKNPHLVILANPPFMTPRGGIRPHDKFSTTATRAEVLFVDYIGENLRTKGRAGIIVPEGIIFQSAESYKKLRKNLIEDWGLYAVVSLPQGVFNPYSGVKTSILLLDRGFSSNDILFVKVENVGFDLGAQKREIDGNNLPVAVSVIQQWKKTQDIRSKYKALAHSVSKEKIAENEEYNLTGERYKEATTLSSANYLAVKLEEFLQEEKERVKNQDIPVWSVSNSRGFINSSEYFNKKVASDDTGNYKIVNQHFFAYNPARINVGSIALNETRNIGSVSPMYVVFSIIDNIGLNSKYLMHLIKSDIINKEIKRLAQGGVRQQLRFGDLKQIKIPIPLLEVQEEIASEIDSYQKVIDGAKQVIANWKPQIKLNPDWQTMELGEICEFVRGVTFSKEDHAADKDDYVLVATTKASQADGIHFDKLVKVKSKMIRREKVFLNHGDILISVANSLNLLGRKTFVKDLDAQYKYSFGAFMGLLRPSKKIAPLFLNYLLDTKKYKDFCTSRANTTTNISNLNWADLSKFQIPLPSLEVQKKIIAEIEIEQLTITANKTLIAKMEQQIADKIGEVWGE